jgi:organic hydroperoxide reductase OsmC/OhrA
MSNFPHIYTTTTQGNTETVLHLKSESLPDLQVSPPTQFGGPEGYWSPETFFSAAVSSCFVLTYKSYARAMKLEWIEIKVDADAYLDKQDSKMSFTKVDIFVSLIIPSGANSDPYLKALKKAEENCLITNSIKSVVHLHPVIQEL